MKTYSNGMKATEFSRKQISVIYGMAKRGEIALEKWVANTLYDLADYYDFDHNGNAEADERTILQMIDAAFAGETEKLQEIIDRYTENTFELLSTKRQAQMNRSLVA